MRKKNEFHEHFGNLEKIPKSLSISKTELTKQYAIVYFYGSEKKLYC